MNKRRWIFALDGARYYQEGDYIYSRGGRAEFSVADGRWYPINGGVAPYYVTDDWVYLQDGKPAFYYD
jgi:hypothetical protein